MKKTFLLEGISLIIAIGIIVVFSSTIIGTAQNNYNITIDPNQYYIFIKPVTTKNNDRQFYKSLLEKL